MTLTITNCGRGSKTLAVRFPETESGAKKLENMLSVSISKLLVTFVGCILCGKTIWEERESRNLLADAWWSYFRRSTPSRKIDLLSL